ncbi:MAG: phosphoribosylglycinamide formyltransferase, partial [Rhodospirillaceae bacterium]|nr:phosphoribosylglycinamide formyltransferase [Rhodospirillaceae bacterium]
MRVGVLISGRGSNLQSLIDARDAGSLPVELVSVISNVAGAPGLERAKAAGITSNVVDHKKFDGRAPFEDALSAALLDADVEFLCLAGFMRLLTDGFVNKWQDRLINIHPSLLPAFKGLDTHARAIEAGVRFAGCTVHFVRPTMDEGPIIVQAAVPILSGDTPASLGERVLAEEHKIYPLAL